MMMGVYVYLFVCVYIKATCRCIGYNEDNYTIKKERDFNDYSVCWIGIGNAIGVQTEIR